MSHYIDPVFFLLYKILVQSSSQPQPSQATLQQNNIFETVWARVEREAEERALQEPREVVAASVTEYASREAQEHDHRIAQQHAHWELEEWDFQEAEDSQKTAEERRFQEGVREDEKRARKYANKLARVEAENAATSRARTRIQGGKENLPPKQAKAAEKGTKRRRVHLEEEADDVKPARKRARATTEVATAKHWCDVNGCQVGFRDTKEKQRHMAKVHGKPSRVGKCPKCECLFNERMDSFQRHLDLNKECRGAAEKIAGPRLDVESRPLWQYFLVDGM